MRREVIRYALMLTLVVALVACASEETPETSPQVESSEEAATPGYATRSNTGDVMFDLTPRGIEDGRFLVDVRVNTHSGDLATVDLQASSRLRVGTTDYAPLEAVPLSGHHSMGVLAFDLDEAPESFEIVISGVRSLEDLSFRWP